MELVQLHVHSEFSILDGCGKQEDYVKRAVELKCPAVCFTEHGSLRGAHKLHENATAAGIKPLYGIEFYAATDHRKKGLPSEERKAIRSQYKGKIQQNRAIREREKELGIRKRFHVTAIAKTNEGLKNLYRLSSKAWLDGFYIRPRIDLNLLEEYGDGLIILSGCIEGYANQALLADDPAKAVEYVERFYDRWGEDFYLEIMPNQLPAQKKVNLALTRISKRFEIPLVATIDAHYILKSDWQTHEVLLCVNTRRKLSDPNRWRFDCQDFWYQTRSEMAQNFKLHHPGLGMRAVARALDATVEIADKCNAQLELDPFRNLLPEPKVPDEYQGREFKYLVDLCMRGWDFQNIPKRAELIGKELGEYGERLKKELAQIREQNVTRYFLLINELYEWVHSQEIICGPGRGSAGGSLVAYLLKLTDIDPVEHGLLFERFLNPERIDLPDIDCDFEDRRRDEILDYIRERYGELHIAQISTSSRMNGRMCLRDLGRVLEIPLAEVGSLSASIVQRATKDERESQVIEDALLHTGIGRKFASKYPDVLRYARRLEGQTRGVGLHAAGVVVSCDELTDWVPLETRARDNERVKCTAFDMHGVEAQGLMKIDVLGLRTLSVIGDCLKTIKDRHDIDVDLQWIDINDKAVLDNFTALNFSGIFQFDAISAKEVCRGVTFNRFDDITAMVSLDRPGTARSGLAAEFLKRKNDPTRKTTHPVIDRICADTLGVIVYQEHAIKIFTDVAGYSPGAADSLRKKIAKSHGDETIREEKDKFISGALANGFEKKLAEELFNKLSFFGSYVFNKAHATAYGMISYRQMWLKTYYPLEFMWALLANEPDQERIARLIREALRMNIECLQPDVSESGETFKLSGNSIRAGLADIKGIGPAAVKSIVEHQPFKSFADFVERVELRKVHKGVISALVKAGAMSELVPNTKWFLENIEELWKKRTKVDWDVVLEGSKIESSFAGNEETIIAAEVSPLASGRNLVELHSDFLDRLSVEWAADLGGKWSWVWFKGTIAGVRYNQVGKYHVGSELDEDEKKQIGWGSQYASVNIEDESGENRRFIIESGVLDSLRLVLDEGVGTPIVGIALTNKWWKNFRCPMMFDVNVLRRKASNGESWTNIEAALMAPDQLFAGMKRSDLVRKVQRTKDGAVSGDALVVSVRRKHDRNTNEMAFLCLYTRAGVCNAVAFASAWPKVNYVLTPGVLARIYGRVQGDNFFIEKAKLHKKRD